MLYIFDVDGTLISSYMDATNQAGVAFGHVTE